MLSKEKLKQLMDQIESAVIVIKKTSDLLPYAQNARTHSEKQVNELAASIKEFGFTNPVLIAPDDTIQAGHGRILAAHKLGLTKVPCRVLDYLTEIQLKAYVLADNQHALNAGWNPDILVNELLNLKEHNFPLKVLGFDDLDKILADLNDEELKDDLDLNDDPEFLIVIECNDENHQKNIFEELQQREYKCKIM